MKMFSCALTFSLLLALGSTKEFFTASSSSWLAGLLACTEQGGTLAVIQSAEENSQVQALLGGEVGWFGLQDFLKGEGTFTWADGSPLGDYTNWARNQPDNNGKGQDCVVIRADGLWNDVTCGAPKTIVCQTE